jgi:hypothetical protein
MAASRTNQSRASRAIQISASPRDAKTIAGPSPPSDHVTCTRHPRGATEIVKVGSSTIWRGDSLAVRSRKRPLEGLLSRLQKARRNRLFGGDEATALCFRQAKVIDGAASAVARFHRVQKRLGVAGDFVCRQDTLGKGQDLRRRATNRPYRPEAKPPIGSKVRFKQPSRDLRPAVE